MSIGNVAEWVAGVATAAAVFVAYWQLSGLNSSLRMNGLVAILQLEADLHSRMSRMTEISARIEEEGAKAKPNNKRILALNRHLEASIEQYLNAVDRIAFCIKKNFVPERDWRAEYRTFIADAIKNYPQFFGADSIYCNILDIHKKWSRE